MARWSFKKFFREDPSEEDEDYSDLLGDMWLILGFKDPELLNEISYQKEAMLILVANALVAQKTCMKRFEHLGDNALKLKYREVRNSYTDNAKILRRIHPFFAHLPLHWSELPGFIKTWQQKTSVKMDQKVVETMKLLEVG